MRKTIVLDTNVLLENPNILTGIPKNDIVVPYKVIEELDKHKYSQGLKGLNARTCSRTLSTLIEKSGNESLKTGIKLSKDSNLFVKSHKEYNLDDLIEENNADDCILKVALGLKKDGVQVTLMSNDILLRIRANTFGLETQGYDSNQDLQSINDLYTGYKHVPVDDSIVEMYYQNKGKEKYFPLAVKKLTKEKLMPNEYLILTNDKVDPKKKPYLLLRYTSIKGSELEYVNSDRKIGKLKALNVEQAIAFDMLMNKDIQLVSLTGLAGTGKTLAAIAAGLEQVMDLKLYQNIIVLRPMHAVGKEIGYLPGPQPLNAKVLTANGWTTMGAINVGDEVISIDGKPSKVLKTFYKGEKEIYKITFEDGGSTECCGDHLWKTYVNNKIETLPTKELKRIIRNDKVSIDFVKPVEFQPSEQLPLHPYIIGAILGDGCVTQKHAVELSNGDKEMVTKINGILPEGVFLRQKGARRFAHSFIMKENIGRTGRKQNILLKIIKDLGLHGTNSKTKFIPKQYLFSSVEDRIHLLQGLMDTDGFVSKDGSDVSLTTISKQLAEDFKSLVFSLGGYANIKHYPNKFNSYTISVSFWDNKIMPVWLTRKQNRYKHRINNRKRSIKSIEATSNMTEMKCIMIEHPEHLYVTDDFIVTHNSKEEKLEPWIAPIKDNLKFLMSDEKDNGRKTKAAEHSVSYLFDTGVIEVEALTYIRGRSLNNTFIIIDEGQNVNTHEMKTILTRAGKDTKIVIVGDTQQIDRIDIDSISNGLSVVVEKFKTYPIAASALLTEGVRSELSELAAKIL